LIRHIAGKSKKGVALQKIVYGEFKKNALVKDPTLLEGLKSNAVRGLANYLIIESTGKDSRLQKSAQTYAAKEVESLKKI
jgi:hypothetical protein